MFVRVSIAVLTAVLASSVATDASAQTPRPLKQWLGEQFQAVARSCLRTSTPNQPADRFIPPDVRAWSTLANRLDSNVPIYALDSLGTYFSTVYLRDATGPGLSREGLQPLGITYAETEATALYARRANGVRQDNCSTLLTASGNLSLPLTASVFRAAMETSVKESTSESLFLYSGTIVSPVAAALGLASTEVDRRTSVDRFSVYLAAWNWYRIQPHMADEGNAGRLEITRVIEGAAVYNVAGLTQRNLLSGNARIGGVIPFLSASAEVGGEGSDIVGGTDTRFGVAILSRAPYGATFHGPARLAREAPLLAMVAPLATNPTSIAGPQPIQWSADLSGVPTAYCDRVFWQLATTANQSSDFTLSNFDVREAPEGARVCRFTVRATPSPTASSNVARLAFSVRSSIDDSNPAVPPLTIPIASTDIADYRASISLANPSGDLEYSLNAGPNRGPLTVALTYLVKEKDGQRATEVISGSPSVEITCGQNGAQGVPLGSEGVVFSRSAAGEGRIALTARIAAGSIFAPDETVATCGLRGQLVVAVQGGASRTLNLPTHAFTVTEVTPTPPVNAR